MPTDTIRVVFTRTEGLPEVTEVIFHHDRLTVCSAGQWLAIPFAPLARWPRAARIRKVLAWFGYPPPWRIIADRNWVDTETGTKTESLFVFYSTPPFKLWLPYEADADYTDSPYFRLQQFLRRSGYDTFDIG